MAVQIQYDITGVKETTESLLKAADLIGMGAERVLDDAANKAETAMRAEAPSFTGELKGSIDTFRSLPGARWIGPSGGGSGYSAYGPTHYARYVEEGGGPSATLANPTDIALRMGLDLPEAFAFAKYLKNTGKAVQAPHFFLEKTANMLDGVFYAMGLDFVRRAIS